MSQTAHNAGVKPPTPGRLVAPDITLGVGETPGPPAYPFLLPPAADGEIGRAGTYRVLRLLGAGGMGMVFAAEDVALRRPVAMKVMNPALEADHVNGWQRFLREARALAAIKHPNLVTVYQAFQERGTVFLVMELLTGETLDAIIRRPAFTDPKEVVRIGTELAVGLSALHEAGLIHRDIKPANIWVESPTGRVRILDLGLVRGVNEDTQLTEVGMVVGTPAYMSPEQARGLPLDPRTDLYSLGCVLFALCAGRVPFEATSPLALAVALGADAPPPVREFNPAVPQPLADLIAELLVKDPDRRPPSAAAVIERLKTVFDDTDFMLVEDSSPAKPVKPAAPTEVEPKPVVKAKLVAEPDTEVARFDRATRREKKAKPKKPKPVTFWRRYGVKLVVGLWVVVVALVAVAIAASGRGKDKEQAKAPDTPALPAPTPAPAPKPSAPAPKTPAATYLAELTPLRTQSWPFRPPEGRPLPPGYGGTITVGGKLFPRGIWMHPAAPGESVASITYKLGGKYDRFQCEVAYNDGAPPAPAPVRFVVRYGSKTWDSGTVARSAKPVCDVDVRGVDELTIEAAADGHPHGAHAVWLDPRLTK